MVNNMVIFSHGCSDWCHICGNRPQKLVDISYPTNAEHDSKTSKYIRICLDCARLMVEIMETGKTFNYGVGNNNIKR